MLKKPLASYTMATAFLLLSSASAFALDCPKAPQQLSKDSEVKVRASVLKIGPVKGGDLQTEAKKVTQDLLSKLPNADKVYLEQMMFAAYCSPLGSSFPDNPGLNSRCFYRVETLEEVFSETRGHPVTIENHQPSGIAGDEFREYP